MATPRNESSFTLRLKPSRSVRDVPVERDYLRIYFQSYPGDTGDENVRGIAGIPYILRIPGANKQISAETNASGEIPLRGLQLGMTAELEIFDTLLRLTPRDFNANEVRTGSQADDTEPDAPVDAVVDKADVSKPMKIQGAKRRLMILGYYDKPYRAGSPLSQTPDDKLNHIEIENAILHFQVDQKLEPNGEIERHPTIKDGSKPAPSIDWGKIYGFHVSRNASVDTQGSVAPRRFDPGFVIKLTQAGGTAPAKAVEKIASQPPMPAREGNDSAPSSVLDRDIYDGQRFIPVRFARPDGINAQFRTPELDERGYDDMRYGPVVSLATGESIQVRLECVHLADPSSLLIKSTDPGIAEVTFDNLQTITVKGVSGGGGSAPEKAVIEVRFKKNPAVLHRLYVEVYNFIEVGVYVSFIQMTGSGGEKKRSAVQKEEMQKAFGEVNRIWSAAAIKFKVLRWISDEDFELKNPGHIDRDDCKKIIFMHEDKGNKFYPENKHRISVYVTPFMPAGSNGMTDSDKGSVIYGWPDVESFPSDYERTLARTVAHEIGHFLGLSHPGTLNGNGDEFDVIGKDHVMEDYWSRRMLMYPYVTGLNNKIITDEKRQHGRQNNVGNGESFPGEMIGCRAVTDISSRLGDQSEIQAARFRASQNAV